MSIARTTASVVVVAALLVTILVGIAPTRPAAAAGCATSTDIALAERSAEDRFVSRLNGLRSSKGLRTLVGNSSIAAGSDRWSGVMAADNQLKHDPNFFSAILSVVSGLLGGAENVGRASLGSPCTTSDLNAAVTSTVDVLHRAFVNSLGHYLNMVGFYNQVGVGVELHRGQLWVTVRFANGPLPAVATENTRRYLDALHQLFLGRRATTSDVDRWASSVQRGDRAAVTRALAVSDEWAGVRIDDLYRSILGRPADASGRRYWLSRVASGMRLEDVAAGFYASGEYFSRNGGTNRGYVNGLYRDILGRRADISGLNHWASLLDSSRWSRTSVAAGFYGSNESRFDRVTTLYREILQRRPDPAGLAYWAERLRTLGDVVLASFLAASTEYYHRSVS